MNKQNREKRKQIIIKPSLFIWGMDQLLENAAFFLHQNITDRSYCEQDTLIIHATITMMPLLNYRQDFDTDKLQI